MQDLEQALGFRVLVRFGRPSGCIMVSTKQKDDVEG